MELSLHGGQEVGQRFLMSGVTAVSFYRQHASLCLKKEQDSRPKVKAWARATFCSSVTEHTGEKREAAATVVTQACVSGGSGCT